MSTRAAAPDRFPLRPLLDGDFRPADVLGWAAGTTRRSPRSSLDVVSSVLGRSARLVDAVGPDESPSRVVPSRPLSVQPLGAPRDRDAVHATLLHRLETSSLFGPAARASSRRLTTEQAKLWLGLAEHCLTVSAGDAGDLRFLNLACKLLGGAWNRGRCEADPLPRSTIESMATVAHEIREQSERIIETVSCCAVDLDMANGRGHRTGSPVVVRARVPQTSPRRSDTALLSGPSVMVLAGRGSAGGRAFIRHARVRGFRWLSLCEYGDPPSQPKSSYDAAWYPPNPTHADTRSSDELPSPGVQLPVDIQTQLASGWHDVAAAISQCEADLVVLSGMPVVPTEILASVPFGAINAHNGALPAYRGMDAVGWAVLEGAPVVCTVHEVTQQPDHGPVIADLQLGKPGFRPPRRDQVKAAQLHLLLQVAEHVRTTGELPAAVEQRPESGRTYYRLHPHLKRCLDHIAQADACTSGGNLR